LPFCALEADQVNAYFAEGMVDDIIRALAGLRELFVIARSSTLGFARGPLDLRRIRHELDVRYVLYGSVRRAREQLRIAVELSDAESRQLIWADRFDGILTEIFELQDRIAMRVASSVAPHVLERELAYAARKHPSNLTAYDLTLRALDQLYRMNRASFFRARELLHKALANDQDYAPAHSHLAYWHVTCIGQGWSQDVQAHAAAAEAAARAAIERDRNDALALALCGHLHSYIRKDYARAAELLDRALAAGPSNAWAWLLSSLTCGYQGGFEAALARAEQAVRLSPIGPDAYWHERVVSQAHYLRGRYANAVARGRMSEAHCAAQTSNLRTLIASHVALGNMKEARRLAQRLLEIDPTFRLAAFEARTPLSGEVREHFAERLRRAGLPE
jgi:adenylate cyclase